MKTRVELIVDEEDISILFQALLIAARKRNDVEPPEPKKESSTGFGCPCFGYDEDDEG